MARRIRCAEAVGLLAAGLLLGCYTGLSPRPASEDENPGAGESEGPSDDDGGSTGDQPDAGHCDEVEVGASVLRRLTRLEYDNTVRDLLGTELRPGRDFIPEEKVLGFDNASEAGVVGELLAEQYMNAAELLAAEAVSDLGTLLPCDPNEGDGCALEFITDFGRRAYRRSLDDAQIDALYAVFQNGRDTHDFTTGIAMVIETMLQSPYFLYRVELAEDELTGETAVALDDWELASRLSYLLWKSMPDDELLDTAEAGALSSPEALRAQAERLLADPRAASVIEDFHVQLLELDTLDSVSKDPARFPAFGESVRSAMLEEARRFVAHAVLEGDGRWETLLHASYTFLNADLAAYYGIPAAVGPELQQVYLPVDEHRGGLLTLGALLARLSKYDSTSPVLRGKFVRERLLCQTPPPPPDNVNFDPANVDPDASARERYEQHSKDPACAACHQLMDPIGFGFEGFDAGGVWRDLENGLPVDISGELVSTEDIDGPFEGTDELAERLAQSEQVRQCVVTQWFRYGYGRQEVEADTCTLEQLQEAFAESGDVRALLVELTQTPAFTHFVPKEEP